MSASRDRPGATGGSAVTCPRDDGVLVLDGLTAVSEGAERLGRLPERFVRRLRIVLVSHADPPPPVAAAVSSRSATVDATIAHGLL